MLPWSQYLAVIHIYKWKIVIIYTSSLVPYWSSRCEAKESHNTKRETTRIWYTHTHTRTIRKFVWTHIVQAFYPKISYKKCMNVIIFWMKSIGTFVFWHRLKSHYFTRSMQGLMKTKTVHIYNSLVFTISIKRNKTKYF